MPKEEKLKKEQKLKEKLGKQYNEDFLFRLKKQKRSNILNQQGIQTLLESFYLRSTVLAELVEDDKPIGQNLIVTNLDGSLNIKKTEKLYENIADFKNKTMEKDWGNFIKEHPDHSNQWYAKRMDSLTKGGTILSLTANMLDSGALTYDEDTKYELRKECSLKGRFAEDSVFIALLQKKEKERLNHMDLDSKRTSDRLFTIKLNKDYRKIFEYQENWNEKEEKWNKKWKKIDEKDEKFQEYLANQKKFKEIEQEPGNREIAVSGYSYLKNIDISYITDEALKKTMAEKLGNGFYNFQKNGGAISVEEYERNQALFQTLDALQEDVKAAKPKQWYRFFYPDKRYRNIEKSLISLREVLKRGETEHNRQELLRAYQKVEDACKEYQKSHSEKDSTWIKKLKTFHENQIGSLKNQIQRQQEQKQMLTDGSMALAVEKKRGIESEDDVKYRKNLTLLGMIGENYRKRAVSNQDIPVFNLAEAVAADGQPLLYLKEREEAREIWNKALEQCQPEIMECSALKPIVECVREAFDAMDPQKEALRYLSIEETNPDQIRKILSDPENQERLKPFMQTVSELICLYEGDSFRAIRYDMEQGSEKGRAALGETKFDRFKEKWNSFAKVQKERIPFGNLEKKEKNPAVERFIRRSVSDDRKRDDNSKKISNPGVEKK